jgi:hypothetical protein
LVLEHLVGDFNRMMRAATQSPRGVGTEGVVGYVVLTLTGEYRGHDALVEQWATRLATEKIVPGESRLGGVRSIAEIVSGGDGVVTAFVLGVNDALPILVAVVRSGIVIAGTAARLAEALADGLRHNILTLVGVSTHEAELIAPPATAASSFYI